ncbi:uncharacterized protein LOC133372791 [Rhineura floridana]|uniref:uncharacterized protein LOC133372791 n=1 Tax=Rhineura floridana TaxID=261503 RepID=UPI002AC7FB91|nr:uncharacterized protein LOC133372791 [Rhineura floridana]
MSWFPETDIGDSEDACRRTPSGKTPLVPKRDVKPDSPPSIDCESHNIGDLADPGELKELASGSENPHGREVGKEDAVKPCDSPKEEGKEKTQPQKTQCTNLLDFRWLQEKEEEEGRLQEDSGTAPEDVSSKGLPNKNSSGDAQEGLWPPPGDNTEEPRVQEPDGPEGSSVDHEAYYLCDEAMLLQDSSASLGYFPCYRTYIEFPRYQPPGHPQDKGSGPSRVGRRKIPQEVQGPQNSPLLPTAKDSRKCPQKRKHRGVSVEEKGQAKPTELKPLLQDQRTLPPSPEGKTGPHIVCCHSAEVAGERNQVGPVKGRGKEIPQRGSTAQSHTSVTETTAATTPLEPRKPPSHLSFHSIISWVWKIFRKPSSSQPQPSTSSRTDAGRRPPASCLRLWITQYRGRVHPQPP